MAVILTERHEKKYFIVYFLFLVQITFGQTYNLDNKYKIVIPELDEWKISTIYCDTINNIYQYITLRKDFKTKERKFSDITIKYEEPNDGIIKDIKKNDCAMGKIIKIDTVSISGYKVRRRFGTNCNWLIESGNYGEIAGYSIDLIVNLDNTAYLRIMSSYYSSDKNELALFETDLLSIISKLIIEEN